MTYMQHPKYPCTAYPLEICNAILELHEVIQAPMPLIGCTVLTALAAAAQGRVKVKLPIGASSKPISIFAVMLGESGERKSVVESYVMEPFHRRDEELASSFKTKLSRFEIEKKLWLKINEQLTRDIVEATQDGDSTDELLEKLLVHGDSKPEKPTRPDLVLQSASTRAVLDALNGRGKSIVLHSDEGDIILKSPLFESSGVLNKGWDGGPVYLDRANGVRIAAHDIRFTFSILVQNNIFRSYQKAKGDHFRDSGFFARCLITAPPSQKGYRFLTGAEPAWRHLPKLHRLITQQLESLPDDRVVPESEQIVYELDDEAKAYWVQLVNDTELQLQPNGHFYDISDFASKACEIAVRISAILHHYSEQTGKVSRDSLVRAAEIVGFHIDEFKRVMTGPAGHISANEDAQKLWQYLYGKHFAYNHMSVPRNILLQYGPIRKNARLQCAIDILAYTRQIWIGRDARGRTFVNSMQVPLPAPAFQG